MMLENPIEWAKVVAIDGPSGSGKSTVAKRMARDLGLLYVDTGAMFRALAYHLHSLGVSMDQEEAVVKNLRNIQFAYGKSEDRLVEINGVNLTQKIREHFVSDLSSQLSKIPAVRSFLQSFQRDLCRENICVMEGRDIGTVVFPGSFCKIFLTASLEVRAQRRFKELQGRGDRQLTLDEVLQDMKVRDDRDTNRKVDPLRPAADALVFDSSPWTLEQVTQKLCDHVKIKAAQIHLDLDLDQG